ncbi:MAG: hypothetical protein JWN96_1683 [Mycobacterium sp.]|nr:hypothetical protein [Mycobacterium sp.]
MSVTTRIDAETDPGRTGIGLSGLNETPGLDAVPPRKRRRWTLPLIGVGLLAILLGLVALSTGSSAGSAYDPRSAEPSGTRALAELLRARGIEVTRGTSAGPDVTVLVPFPSELSDLQLSQLISSGADVVLGDPGTLGDAQVDPAGSLRVKTREPGCSFAPAELAGAARLGGERYTGPVLAISCYDGSLLTLPADSVPGSGRITVLGSGDFLTNEHLDEQGNAALAIGLLSSHPKLTWYTGRPSGDGTKSLTSLLPNSLKWAFLQLGIALLFAAAWRARRLGPVVSEPLPVVVRAAETVLGRARLYATARARSSAASALRSGSRARLATLIHLDPSAAPQEMIAAVAARTGTEPARVAGLLYEGGGYGAARSEAALVRLAADLDTLEQLAKEVARR